MRIASAQSKPPVVIGWLASRSRKSSEPEFAAFKEGLAEFGWKEPQIVIEERWAEGYYDRLPALAQELAAKKPAVIVASGGQGTHAAVKGAPGIPIVTAGAGDLVKSGLAASLARPGGMVTGLDNVTLDVSEKFVELVVAAVPKVKRVGCLINPGNVNYVDQRTSIQRSAARHSVDVRFVEVIRPEDIEKAISMLATQGVQAVVAMTSSVLVVERRRIVALALANQWPVIAGNREFAEAGALLTYGFDSMQSFRRAAYYVDRILKGAKPGDLPIELATKIELVLNMKTARALKLEIPASLAVRADRVIE